MCDAGSCEFWDLKAGLTAGSYLWLNAYTQTPRVCAIMMAGFCQKKSMLTFSCCMCLGAAAVVYSPGHGQQPMALECALTCLRQLAYSLSG